MAVIQTDATDTPVSTAAGDVDGDGCADLVTGHVPASATTAGEYTDAEFGSVLGG